MDHKEARAAWVKALRSGEYQQGRGALQSRENSFCCLGIACIAAEKNGIPVNKDSGYIVSTSLDHWQEKVRLWLGLRTPPGSFCAEDGTLTTLARLNDFEFKTFLEIADVIESEPEGLFED